MTKETLVDDFIKSIPLLIAGVVVWGSINIFEAYKVNKYNENRGIVVNCINDIISNKTISKELIDSTEESLQNQKYNQLDITIGSVNGQTYTFNKINKNDISNINLETGDIVSVSAYYDKDHSIYCTTLIKS